MLSTRKLCQQFEANNDDTLGVFLQLSENATFDSCLPWPAVIYSFPCQSDFFLQWNVFVYQYYCKNSFTRLSTQDFGINNYQYYKIKEYSGFKSLSRWCSPKWEVNVSKLKINYKMTKNTKTVVWSIYYFWECLG